MKKVVLFFNSDSNPMLPNHALPKVLSFSAITTLEPPSRKSPTDPHLRHPRQPRLHPPQRDRGFN